MEAFGAALFPHVRRRIPSVRRQSQAPPSRLLVAACLLGGQLQEQGLYLLQRRRSGLAEQAPQTVGWYYLLAMTLYLIFVVVTALSGYGKIKLGADHDEPEFSYLSWAGMLFAAGIS
ncbi:BCCT family transporter, partial [Pseudomonas aeruginosa]